jgi:hypothetical protein
MPGLRLGTGSRIPAPQNVNCNGPNNVFSIINDVTTHEMSR